MKVSYGKMVNMLRNNVCEVKTSRRILVEGRPAHRRMLCTLCMPLLNSIDGRMSLNYKPPSHPAPYNPAQYNLIVVWDIFMQDWRCLNMDDCQLISFIPGNEEFWQYFNAKLRPMSSGQKQTFMDV